MKINCFIPFFSVEQVASTIAGLKQSAVVNKIYLLSCQPPTETAIPSECELLPVPNLTSSETMAIVAQKSDAAFTLFYTKYTHLELGQFALERFCAIASDTGAGMLYSDYYQAANNVRKAWPVNDYQIGSVRDDFNVGSLLFFNANQLKRAVQNTASSYLYAGLYNVRLLISQQSQLLRINEFLYTEIENDLRTTGEKQFDYVDPRNRDVQVEMEYACTEHLKAIGAYLKPSFKEPDLNSNTFEYEASVIIPVKDRRNTLEDAIVSVLKQKTNFNFNLIIVDNHSTDGTSELIEKHRLNDARVVHIIPESTSLGIGGCWNEGVASALCGKFAVQLDSDDVYQQEHSLQTIVDAFYEQKCAMVIGSYTMTNAEMEEIPPGLIDHREWTPDNGRNNALRINGLGAPRAFYTPLLREVKLPNTGYGEDYAVGLRISREYQIGRIYESIYLCRRWEGNSDANLDVSKLNANNAYKDKLRSIEIMARQKKMNK